mmetsp:Transcript_34043/g.85698  ORF Transcript_34043/g.85698 Transcript_34043/m.85698 type:complete len:200 (-) Transcript_34043:839-1438(-)
MEHHRRLSSVQRPPFFVRGEVLSAQHDEPLLRKVHRHASGGHFGGAERGARRVRHREVRGEYVLWENLVRHHHRHHYRISRHHRTCQRVHHQRHVYHVHVKYHPHQHHFCRYQHQLQDTRQQHRHHHNCQHPHSLWLPSLRQELFFPRRIPGQVHPLPGAHRTQRHRRVLHRAEAEPDVRDGRLGEVRPADPRTGRRVG